MSSTIKILLAAVVLAVGGGIYFATQSGKGEAASPAATKGAGGGGARGGGGNRVVTVEVAESRIGRVKERVQLTGALKPKEQVDLTPKTAGRLVRILVNVGDTVKKGALIAELEDDELQQQVHRANASISVASASLAQREAELANAKQNLERAHSLLQDGLIPRQQYEADATALRVLEAQVQLSHAQRSQAESELRELNIRLEQTKIYSPIDGQVATRYVDVGALVGPSTPIVRLVNIATLVTSTSVPEAEVAKMSIGTPATVRVDAMPDNPFQGRVARISPVLDPSTRTATIEIEIPNPGMQLRAEMFVRVEMNLESSREAVLIPRESLVYRGESSGVYVVERGKHVFRFIETGLTQEDSVEVLSNLEPGTQIVAKGASMLREGDTMQVVSSGGGKEVESAVPAAVSGGQSKSGDSSNSGGLTAQAQRSVAEAGGR